MHKEKSHNFCTFGGNVISCPSCPEPVTMYPADTQCRHPWSSVDPQRSWTKGRNSLDSPLTQENGRQGNPEIGKQRKTSWPWKGVGMNVHYEPPGVGVWWQMPPICCSESLNWSIYGGRNCPVSVCNRFLEQTHKLAHPISSYNSFLPYVFIS